MSPQHLRQAIGKSLTEYTLLLGLLLFMAISGVAAAGIAEEARLERLATVNAGAPVALIGAAAE